MVLPPPTRAPKPGSGSAHGARWSPVMSSAAAPNTAARSSNDVDDARARAAADAVINGS